jgi:hypothetical protein
MDSGSNSASQPISTAMPNPKEFSNQIREASQENSNTLGQTVKNSESPKESTSTPAAGTISTPSQDEDTNDEASAHYPDTADYMSHPDIEVDENVRH